MGAVRCGCCGGHDLMLASGRPWSRVICVDCQWSGCQVCESSWWVKVGLGPSLMGQWLRSVCRPWEASPVPVSVAGGQAPAASPPKPVQARLF